MKGLNANILIELSNLDLIISSLEKTLFDDNMKKINNIKELQHSIISGKSKNPMMIFVYILMFGFIKSFGILQSKKFFFTPNSLICIYEF